MYVLLFLMLRCRTFCDSSLKHNFIGAQALVTIYWSLAVYRIYFLFQG